MTTEGAVYQGLLEERLAKVARLEAEIGRLEAVGSISISAQRRALARTRRELVELETRGAYDIDAKYL